MNIFDTVQSTSNYINLTKQRKLLYCNYNIIIARNTKVTVGQDIINLIELIMPIFILILGLCEYYYFRIFKDCNKHTVPRANGTHSYVDSSIQSTFRKNMFVYNYYKKYNSIRSV